MTIPQTLEFAAILDTLRIGDAPGQQQAFNVRTQTRGARTADGQHLQSQPLWLSANEGGLSLESLISKLRRELAQHGHVDSDSIAGCILALVSLLPSGRRLERLNEILSSIVSTGIVQYVVFPRMNDFEIDLQFGSFKLGRLDRERLEYRSRKAGSDYFQLWGDSLASRHAIERERVQAAVIPWPDGQWSSEPPTNTDAARLLIDEYFSEVASMLMNQFWARWDEEQEIFNALDAATIPAQKIKFIPKLELITIFENISGSKGWVSPGLQTIGFDFGGTDRRIRTKAEELEKRFGFTGYGANELDNVLRAFVKMVSRARIRDLDDAPNEAALHFVIALDLLFGDKNASTRSVSSRAAAAASQSMNIAFVDCLRSVRRVYDARSLYVHEAKSISEADAQFANRACLAVLEVMLRLHRRQTSEGELVKVEEWLAALDYVAAARTAKVVVDDEFAIRWGLIEA